MYKDNFTLVIESNSKQITPLKLQMEKSEVKFKYILLEDYDNLEELFMASDIFILPTIQKYFSLDILKAMYYRNAIFVMESNHSSEIIDTFSLIQSAADRSISFKVDSLLINKEELRKIQKENQKIAINHSLENSIKNISKIMSDSFDI
jgi:DNA polymerase III delta prime subunit